MKIDDAKLAYEDLSGKASDIMRQLGLAGVALVWLFRVDTTNRSLLDTKLLCAAFFIFLAIIFDFLQYVIGATIWFRFFRCKENEGVKPDQVFQAPPKLNLPTWALFFLKTVMILTAYVGFIIPFLWMKFGA
jgi:hypothetical protein